MIGSFRNLILFSLVFLLAASGLRADLAGAEQQRLADGLYVRGLYELALVEYQKQIEAEPPPENLDLLYYRAGECASHTNQRALAASYFQKAVTLGGDDLAAQRSRYRLADEAYRGGDLATAEQQLRKLREGKVDASIDAPVRFTLAQILESRGQSAEALTLYKTLIKDYPGESLSAYAALRVAALSGEGVEDKRKYYQQALQDPPSRDFEIEALWGLAGLEAAAKKTSEAAKTYWRLWEEFPDSTRVRGGMIHLAWAQLQAGEYQHALTLSEATSESRKAADADTWLYLDAVSHEKLNQSEAALHAFETLLEKYPDSRFRSLAVYEVAGTYGAKGEHQKVLAYAKELQQIPGREVEGLWLLAESARGAGDLRQAMQVYTRIAHQYPKSEHAPDASYFKAQLLVESGDMTTASNALVDFYRRYPDDPRSLPALEQAGDLLVKGGELKAGVGKWKDVLNQNQQAPTELLFKTAMVQIRLKEMADAKVLLEKYLQTDLAAEKQAEGEYWLGILLGRKGEDTAAQKILESALQGKLKPELQPSARMRLGQSYTRSGNSEKALSAFLPLLGTPREAELSDGLLLWLLPVAKDAGMTDAENKIANAMIKEARKPATREWGYYALAAVNEKEGKPGAAEQAWKNGLAYKSGTLEAAQADLDFAEFLLKQKKYEPAFAQFSEATQLASTLEQGRLQALGMMGSARVRRAEENWKDAARYYMSVAVLFDDPELSPEALRQAAEAFRRAGQPAKAAAAEKELNTRYPPPATPTP